MRAREITPPLALDSYQRAARVILSNHLITSTYPDRIALPLLRRWATELRDDLLELFGYRLEVTETTARLFTVSDRLNPSAPARTASERTFDRTRYAYLALCLAALGRAGNQITLSELADHVAADAAQVDGVELSTDRASDRDAFVDAVAGSESEAPSPSPTVTQTAGRPIPKRRSTLRHRPFRRRSAVPSTARPAAPSLHPRTPGRRDLERLRGRRNSRGRERDRTPSTSALVERPVVLAGELDQHELIALAQPKTASEVELLTGLVAERRAEGIAMIDPTGRLSDVRFPSTGTIAQVALLLAGEIADRVLDVDAPELPKLPIPHVSDDHLIEQLDAAIPPEAGIFEDLADEEEEFPLPAGEPTEPPEPVTYPKIDDDWLADKVTELVDQFGRTFAAQWQADHNGLRKQALGLLQRLRLTHAVDGGVLVLPVLARYRDVVVSVRERDPQIDFAVDNSAPDPSTNSAPNLPPTANYQR